MNATARATETATRWVLFSLDAGRYALPLESVERIVHAAEITALPLAPDVVLGAIDIAGDILPVYDLRRRFRLAARPLRIADQFIVARAARRRVVLVVDAAVGVHDGTDVPSVDSARLLARAEPASAAICGVISLPDGLVLIQDLERFLSVDESDALDAALEAMREREALRRAR